jgi:hypothetical protein
VEGIPVFWKAQLFAGLGRNGGLGRSVVFPGSSRDRSAPMTADVRRAPRRGTRSRMRPKRMHPSQARVIVASAPETRPSHGPSTRARIPRRSKHGRSNVRGEAPRLDITAGQTHASGRNQHWGRMGGRRAARRVSPVPRGTQRGASDKEGGRGLRPCEETRAPVGVRTSCLVAEVSRRRLGLE